MVARKPINIAEISISIATPMFVADAVADADAVAVADDADGGHY